MSLRPSSVEELQSELAQATASHARIGPVDVSCLNRLIEHKPADLTCTVECGTTLAQLQAILAVHKQWLPLDPPHSGEVTLRDVIDGNLTGSRRLGFGTVRDYLIGLEVVLADGTRIRSGGRVVKNVAGYDLHKLFIGSHGSLGVPVVATFKLLPRPESIAALRASREHLAEAAQLAEVARRRLSGLVALDLYRLPTADAVCRLTVQFAGTERDVAHQSQCATALGFAEGSTVEGDEHAWPVPGFRPERFSVLPSRIEEALKMLSGRVFLVRAGNGIVYHDGPPISPRPTQPRVLLDRLKTAFDPLGILPPLPE